MENPVKSKQPEIYSTSFLYGGFSNGPCPETRRLFWKLKNLFRPMRLGKQEGARFEGHLQFPLFHVLQDLALLGCQSQHRSLEG